MGAERNGELTILQFLRAAIREGFTPQEAVDLVLACDLLSLGTDPSAPDLPRPSSGHTGLTSVQLQPSPDDEPGAC